MSNEVASLKSVQEKLETKIKEQFVDLVPDELWEGLVEAQIKQFAERELPRIVNEQAEKMLKEIVVGIFKADDMTTTFNDMGTKLAGELVKKFVSENGTELMLSMFGPALQNMAVNLRDSIINTGRY